MPQILSTDDATFDVTLGDWTADSGATIRQDTTPTPHAGSGVLRILRTPDNGTIGAYIPSGVYAVTPGQLVGQASLWWGGLDGAPDTIDESQAFSIEFALTFYDSGGAVVETVSDELGGGIGGDWNFFILYGNSTSSRFGLNRFVPATSAYVGLSARITDIDWPYRYTFISDVTLDILDFVEPTDVDATPANCHRVNFTWTPFDDPAAGPDGTVYYPIQIWRSINGTDFDFLMNSTAGALGEPAEDSDTTVDPDTHYWYRIYSRDPTTDVISDGYVEVEVDVPACGGGWVVGTVRF